MPKKRIRRPCVPDDFEEELTQEECDMIDKWFPQYEDEAEEPEGGCPTCEDETVVERVEAAERVKCVCGSIIMPKSMKSHEKTKKHLAFISETIL
jgi:ribosomal protein S27E